MTMPGLDAWAAWPPQTLAARLAGVDTPWYVAGGWAIDLFLGTTTRSHEDLEIAVPAARFDAVAARFPDCDFYVAHDGGLQEPTPQAMRTGHQTWACERSAMLWRFDVFREPHDGDTWISRRDPRIHLPYREIIEHSADGVPYLAPQVALLFKAKAVRPKDEADFTAALPHLSPARRRWLAGTLAMVHPDHPWQPRLAAGPPPAG
ncbi:hypothetical protein AB0M46_25165 [Dactylosporangium sp. NPDC051485]|uniref:nucleotidyltransferase domain-containing protein n=1 Tax=Dactylosporangium sp. NPDC051485 TaxID=3154846 RepID=UPI00343F0B0E